MRIFVDSNIFAPIHQSTIALAKEAHIKDFEDALQYAMAKKSHCQYIITRNIKDFKNISDLGVLQPSEYLKRL